MNHYQAYRIGFDRGYTTHTLYEWVGDENYAGSFRMGTYHGIEKWLKENSKKGE